jgi:DTW domain-containing protein YfiP
MRSHSAPDLAGRCVNCRVVTPFCLCAELEKVETRTRFVIVRHALEAWKSTNTGRIAMLALTNATLAPYGDEAGPFDATTIPSDGWLLFPDGVTTPAEPPTTIVVLDGSWAQARRMTQRLPEVRRLPRFTLPAFKPLARLRSAPRADGMSTLEAIARTVEVLEGKAVAEPLLRLAALHTERSRRARGR